MADLGHRLTDKKLEELEERIAEEYARASRDMQKKFRDWLEQYTEAEAKQRALFEAGQITEKELQSWRFRHIAVGRRWEAMKNALAQDLEHASEIALKIARGGMADVYALNANFAAYQIEHDAGINAGFTLYNHDTAEYLLKEQRQLMPGPSTKRAAEIAADKSLQWNKRHIQSAVLQGILQGESPHKVAERLRSVAEMNYNASVRYARTMTTSAQNAGRYESFHRAKKLGVDLTIEWQATLDGRTRHDHRLMHGQRREVDEPFILPSGEKILYPADSRGNSYALQGEIWNCRCTLKAWVKGFEHDTVKSSPGMRGMSFEEWQNEKGTGKTQNIKENKDENTTTAKQKRSQIDTGYSGQIPSKDLETYNQNALNQIIQDTGYSQKEAAILQADLQEYLGGDYESFTAGKQIDRVKRIDDGISRMPAYEGQIYRGMYLDEQSVKSYISLSAGDQIEMKSISSWTSKKTVAERYGNIQGKETSSVLIQCVDNKTSAGVQHISKWGTSEAEVLAMSTAKWEVIESASISKYEYLKQETERKLDTFVGPKIKRRILESTLSDLEKQKAEYENVYMVIVKVSEI